MKKRDDDLCPHYNEANIACEVLLKKILIVRERGLKDFDTQVFTLYIYSSILFVIG
jgi:hypothetical protein